MTPTSRRILVVGGGPSGAVSAYWLATAGFEVTVAERSTDRFATGQGIDITGPGVEIMKKMGLLTKIKANTTGEGGFSFLDDQSRTIASMGMATDTDGGSLSVTQEIEILRGTLTRILADAAMENPNVTYRYGCSVSEIRQQEKSVTVVLTDTDKVEEFAAIIGADGLGSKVRKLAFDGEAIKNCYVSRRQYAGFFTMAGKPEDVPNARFQNAIRGRSFLIRPISKTDTTTVSGYTFCTGKTERLESARGKSVAEQKEAFLSLFADFPGEMGERARQGLRDSEDFYFTEIAQVKLDKWSSGRCVLAGDAAYAPSSLTGQGTVLAILGAYVLAGEIASNKDDLEAAFASYESHLRDYVTRLQRIPLGGYAPNVLNPQSKTAIWLLRTVFWLFARSGVWKWFSIQQEKKTSGIVPNYKFE